MISNKMTKTLFTLGIALTLFVAGCGAANDVEENAEDVNNNQPEEDNETATENETMSDINMDDLTEINGADPGGGVFMATEEAIEEYDLDLVLTPSSDAAMTAALGSAVRNEEPIVVTGWTPHWKFAAYDLKFLDDPKGIYGEAESIHTLVRHGLEEDHSSAYQVLDRFFWEADDMNKVMVDINQNDMEEFDAANVWIEENREKVDTWIEGTEEVNGETIELAYATWDSEIASTHVVASVLQDIGYEVELTPLEASGLFTGVASGDVDGMVAAWLPHTHQAYYDEYQEEFEDLGPNMVEEARIGLVVPEYMDIDSIEDLSS